MRINRFANRATCLLLLISSQWVSSAFPASGTTAQAPTAVVDDRMTPEQAMARMRALKGFWTNGEMMWAVRTEGSAVIADVFERSGRVFRGWEWKIVDGQLNLSGWPQFMFRDGAYHPISKWSLIFLDDGSFRIVSGKWKNATFIPGKENKYTLLDDAPFVRSDLKEAQRFISGRNDVMAAKAREEASSGNNGMLGGLIMGGMAAAMGGDAGVVMGAAMKGVSMTTDNEMTRNVLAGQGDAMIQSSIDTQRQIAETERLRVAAAEETRRKSEAAAAGRSYVPSPSGNTPPSSMPSAASSAAPSAGAAISEARTTRYSYCYASNGARATHISGIGSKSTTVNGQVEWRNAMEAEFRSLTGASGPLACYIKNTPDFAYTRDHILDDNPIVLSWSPH